MMAAFLILTLQAAAGECLKYEPEVVTLRGTIERHTYPGPPEYASVEAGDEKVTYWYLRLDRPLCTVAGGDDDTPAESGQTLVQLVLPARGDHDNPYRRYRALFGHHVDASGKLFHQQVGRHYTKVLIHVNDMKASPREE